MKNTAQNHSWFSIVIAILMTALIGLTAIYILEYIIPFGRNVKWVENASKSFYLAQSWIEESLWFLSQNNIWDQDAKALSTLSEDFGYTIIANGSQIPLDERWNSEYNNNYNTLSKNNPIQLQIWNDLINNWSTVSLDLRVPATLDNGGAYSVWWTTDPIVNWQISSPENTLNSDGSWFTANDINSSSQINIWTRRWIDLQWNTSSISTFYASNCVTQVCALKISVIEDMRATVSNSFLPYLEYQIDFWSSVVPLRFAQIESSWKSFWFRKDLEANIPQLTLDEAFDFTVLQ